MSALPAGWVWAELGELGTWRGGGTPSKANQSFWTNGTIPWVSPKDMKVARIGDAEDHITSLAVENSATNVVPAGSVLVVTRSGILERTLPVAVTTRDVALNQDLKCLTPADGISAEYVAAFLRASERRVLRDCAKSGTTVASLEAPALLRFRIPIAPYPEQLRIVAAVDERLTELEAGTETLKHAQVQLKRYRAAVLKAACDGRLVSNNGKSPPRRSDPSDAASITLEGRAAERRRQWESATLARLKTKGRPPGRDDWRSEYQAAVGPPADLPGLPEGWCWATIDQLLSSKERSLQSGPFGSNLLHSEFQNEGVLAIGIDNVLNGAFTLGNQNRISESKFAELRKYQARPLDVLITVMATVGRCCLVPADLGEPAIITKHVYRITVDQALIHPRMLMIALLGSPVVRRQLYGEVKGQTRPGINGEILRRLCVPVPPLTEGARILEKVDCMLSIADEVESAVSFNLRRAAALRQSILRHAFEGRLVPQDPNDEPASELLARIRAAREAAVPAKKSRSKRLTA